MLADAREIPDQTEIHTDVCIVGAGIAGTTIAHELLGKGMRVYVLESGGTAPNTERQQLSETESVGLPIMPTEDTQVRAFGGGSHVWSGKSRPLEEIDFEKRDWIPHSGWPVTRSDLEPYYQRAGDLTLLPLDASEVREWEAAAVERHRLADGPLRMRFYAQSPLAGPRHFGSEMGPDLVASPESHVVLYAQAHEILSDESNRVAGVVVAARPGHRFTIRASRVVLAAGAIQNTRLLLLSKGRHKSGLGNHHDQLGRYYTDRRGLNLGFVRTRRPAIWEELTFKGRVGDTGCAGLVLADDVIRRERLLNAGTFAYELWPPRYAAAHGGTSAGFEALLEVNRDIRRRRLPSSQAVWKARGGIREAARVINLRLKSRIWRDFVVETYSEPLPNPDSRIALSHRRDQFGLPLPLVDWQVADEFVDYLARYLDLFRTGVRKLDPTAQLDIGLPTEFTRKLKMQGAHHMGTTRMSNSPQHGVVDQNCQVHGVEGLYVAGSSVFTTYGAGNPTFTILALAIRLAEHLIANTSRQSFIGLAGT